MIEAQPTSPFLLTATNLSLKSTLLFPPFISIIRLQAYSQASCGCIPSRIFSTTKKLPQVLMTSSPRPVAPAAPTRLSTYNPAPMIGLSPTRPGIFPNKPLVVVIPAMSPLSSIPSTLIVPVGLFRGSYLPSLGGRRSSLSDKFSFHLNHLNRAFSVRRFSSTKP